MTDSTPIQFGNCPMHIVDRIADREFVAPQVGRYAIIGPMVTGIARRTVELPKQLLGMSVGEARSRVGERVRIAAPMPFTAKLDAVEEEAGGDVVRLTLSEMEMATPNAAH
jgi:hypothetical protein